MDTKRSIEDISDIYLDGRMTGAVQRYNMESLKAAVPYFNGTAVLELGSGDGVWTQALCDHFLEMDVVDASEQVITHLAEIVEGCVTYHCSLFEKFTTDKRFGTIIAAHILEHVDDPVNLLSQAAQWLTENGRIIIVVPNAFSIHRHVGVTMGLLEHTTQLSKSDLTIGHKRVYTKPLLLKDIDASGLHVSAYLGVGFKPLADSQLDMLNQDIVKAFVKVGRQIPEGLCNQIVVVCEKTR